VVLGALVGVFGLCLLFFPDIRAGGVFDTQSLFGLLLACCGTLSFCTGNFLSARLQARRVPISSASAWGMLYGAGFLALFSALYGLPFTIEPTSLYLGSLLWSALISSVLAFGAYLSLLGRIGPARAGYLTVLIPVFALVISSLLEGYAWTLWSFLGLAAVGVGNVLVLRRG
jgi:drug/metabolite transporter (DMT)-like permease